MLSSTMLAGGADPQALRHERLMPRLVLPSDDPLKQQREEERKTMRQRQARPVLPIGPFYVKGLSLHGFAIFNATPAEQRRCAEDIDRWLAEKKLLVEIGRTFHFAEAAEAHRLQEENTLQKAGTLTGKIVLVP